MTDIDDKCANKDCGHRRISHDCVNENRGTHFDGNCLKCLCIRFEDKDEK